MVPATVTQCCFFKVLCENFTFPPLPACNSFNFLKQDHFKRLIFGGDFETIIKPTEADVPDTQEAKRITQQLYSANTII